MTSSAGCLGRVRGLGAHESRSYAFVTFFSSFFFLFLFLLRGFSTERARLGTFRGFETERRTEKEKQKEKKKKRKEEKKEKKEKEKKRKKKEKKKRKKKKKKLERRNPDFRVLL